MPEEAKASLPRRISDIRVRSWFNGQKEQVSSDSVL